MPSYVVVQALDMDTLLDPSFAERAEGARLELSEGCVWVFRIRPEVDDAESALRRAVQEFLGTEAGRRLRDEEGEQPLTWESTIPWIADETWERHGLELLRHPDVQRIVLDCGEPLVAENGPRARRAAQGGDGSPAAHRS